MSSGITDDLLSNDIAHAMGDFPITLTITTPTAYQGQAISATKQDIKFAYTVEVNGREQEVDTKFYLNAHTTETLPEKGWLLQGPERNYKVFNVKKDSSGIEYSIDCISQYQRS